MHQHSEAWKSEPMMTHCFEMMRTQPSVLPKVQSLHFIKLEGKIILKVNPGDNFQNSRDDKYPKEIAK